MFHGLDRPGSQALRREFRAAHETYLAQHPSTMMARGPLVTDDGQSAIGSVLLLDVPDMDTARGFMEKEPFFQAAEKHPSAFNHGLAPMVLGAP
jgi:uncharacterized protein YciI